MSPGGKGVANVSARTFRTVLKAVGNNSENMSSKIHNSLQDFSTMQNIRMQYELYEGLHRPERTGGSYTNESALSERY